jgi:glycosyltransferase involved in cell wall biosynthesis
MTPRLDVLFVLGSLAVGGSERKIVALATALDAQGFRIGVAILEADMTLAKLLPQTVQIWRLGRTGKFSWGAVLKLRRLLSAQCPRTLVAVNQYAALYTYTARLFHPCRPRQVGLINVTHLLRRRDRLALLLYRQLLRTFDTVVFGCHAHRLQWLPANSSALRRSTVIYNGVDAEHFCRAAVSVTSAQLREQWGIPPDSLLVGSVGRLAPDKNQQRLLHGFAQLRASGIPAHLLLVGDGPDRAKLHDTVRALSLQPYVHFAGSLSDVRESLAAMDLFVLPSIEAFSNAALEAMAMGLPVILTDQGGGPEMITTGKEGALVDITDFENQFTIAASALWQNPARRAAVASAARATIEQRFTFIEMVRAYVGAFGLSPR